MQYRHRVPTGLTSGALTTERPSAGRPSTGTDTIPELEVTYDDSDI